MPAERRHIHVVAAVIRRGDEIFATQRGHGNYKDWWEFPGGKIEPGETPEQALVREIKEELAATIAVDAHIATVDTDYPEYHVTMDSYWCHVTDGELTLLEHEAAMWLPLDDPRQVRWLPTDLVVLDEIERSLQTE